jgi:acyl-CoA synthetase (AMP-forming)/AMP-acid ligase II
MEQACSPPQNIQTLPELFANTARQYPQRPALSYSLGDTLHTQCYSDLAGRVRQISDMLREKLGIAFNATPGENVPPVLGIWFERSADLTVAVLAATTAGSTWLPFDPDAPVDRVKACLVDSKATLILCDDAHYDRTCDILQSIQTCNVVRFSDLTADREPTRQVPSSEPQPYTHPCDPAYLIYTSGSKSLHSTGIQEHNLIWAFSNSHWHSKRDLHSS